jgi:hypothetical protein
LSTPTSVSSFVLTALSSHPRPPRAPPPEHPCGLSAPVRGHSLTADSPGPGRHHAHPVLQPLRQEHGRTGRRAREEAVLVVQKVPPWRKDLHCLVSSITV